MGANGWVGLATISGGRGEAERVGSVQVTDGFFPTLRVRPQFGRLIPAEDDRPGAARVAVISDGFWRRRFGADRVDRRPVDYLQRHAGHGDRRAAAGLIVIIEINRRTRRRRLHAIPLGYRAAPTAAATSFAASARLKDGVSLDAGPRRADTIAARLEQQYPVEQHQPGRARRSLLDSMVGESRPVVMLLAGAVIVVLLVACANVANLLLARGTGRLRELALRAAIGADRGRLVRQMLTESVALSLHRRRRRAGCGASSRHER